MQIDESLRFFVNHLQPKAIVLKGQWGVGKTFYWREQIVKGYFAEANLKSTDRGYAYASLFGIESIQQLKNALAYSYEENKSPRFFRSLWNRARSLLRSASKVISKYVHDEIDLSSEDIGIKVKATSLLNDFAFFSIRRSLICIDDLERRNQGLSIGDVLGLVSYLVDQRQCRVILILNFDSLTEPERAEWERSKDKTFEAELLYQPSLEASIHVGLIGTEHEWWHEEARSCLTKLQCDNIRVIARTQRFLRQLLASLQAEESLKDIPNDVWKDVVRVGCLLMVAHNSRAQGAPSMESLLQNSLLRILKEEDVEELSDGEKKWKEIVDGYGIYMGDRLDEAISRSIKDGYPRIDLLVPAALDWRQAQEKSARAMLFRAPWDRFHNSLGNDTETLIEEFLGALPAVIPDESVHNISSTGKLLRELGRPEEATATFRAWIDARTGTRRKELEEDEWFPGETVDQEFLEMIEAARIQAPALPKPLVEALQQIDTGSFSMDSIAAVSNAQPSEIAEILTKEYRSWRRCIQVLVSYSGHDEIGERARENFKEALRSISATSPLNALRIRGKLGGAHLDPAPPRPA